MLFRSNVKELPPLEKWIYFLQHAEHLDSDELDDRLVDDEFREATGVLEMISKSPEDRQYYEARMKFLHDEQARLLAAREAGREAGREEGREEGSLFGKIQLLQQLLGDEATGVTDLLRRGSEELNKLLSELQDRLRSR